MVSESYSCYTISMETRAGILERCSADVQRRRYPGKDTSGIAGSISSEVWRATLPMASFSWIESFLYGHEMFSCRHSSPLSHSSDYSEGRSSRLRCHSAALLMLTSLSF